MTQRPQRDEALGGLDTYEQMVNSFAKNAKDYWRLWGALGEPMLSGVEAWAQMQRSYLRWLRETSEAGGRSPISSRYAEADETTKSSRIKEEAQRSAKESAREAQRIAREQAERNAREEEAERAPTEEIRSTIRESVRQSEVVGVQKETQVATPEEIETGAEELPIEDYDSLNVNQVSQRLRDLSVEEIERLRDYEAENKDRRSLLDRFERRIRAAREDLDRSSAETEKAPREDIRSIVRESVGRSSGEA